MSATKLPVVLSVDDEESTRWLIKHCISELQIEILFATSVSEGKENISQHKIDIVICDYHLKDGTGLEVLRHLKDEGKSIPFLLFTGEDFSNIPHISYLNFSFVGKTEPKKLKAEVVRQLEQIRGAS